MDRILLLMLTSSIVICNGRPSTTNLSSTLRAIVHYANPFAWIGTPNWPRRRTNRKTDAGYLWVIEIDGKFYLLFHFIFFSHIFLIEKRFESLVVYRL